MAIEAVSSASSAANTQDNKAVERKEAARQEQERMQAEEQAQPKGQEPGKGATVDVEA